MGIAPPRSGSCGHFRRGVRRPNWAGEINRHSTRSRRRACRHRPGDRGGARPHAGRIYSRRRTRTRVPDPAHGGGRATVHQHRPTRCRPVVRREHRRAVQAGTGPARTSTGRLVRGRQQLAQARLVAADVEAHRLGVQRPGHRQGSGVPAAPPDRGHRDRRAAVGVAGRDRLDRGDGRVGRLAPGSPLPWGWCRRTDARAGVRTLVPGVSRPRDARRGRPGSTLASAGSASGSLCWCGCSRWPGWGCWRRSPAWSNSWRSSCPASGSCSASFRPSPRSGGSPSSVAASPAPGRASRSRPRTGSKVRWSASPTGAIASGNSCSRPKAGHAGLSGRTG